MKKLLPTLVLASMLALSGTSENVQAVTDNIYIAQTQKAVNNKPITLALPTVADVALKNGTSLTGQVIGFNAKKQTIEITRDGASGSRQISQIQRVTFRRDALVYTSTGQVVVRGEDNAQAKQSTWENIPLNAFVLLNPSRGQAKVDLSTVLNPKKLRPIWRVAQDSSYVVDEISFQPAGKMTIKATPH